MTFYSDPAFFILLAVAAVPAIILGMLQKSIRIYGLAVSVAFLALLFGKDAQGAVSLLVFLAIDLAATFATLRAFRAERPHAVALYRACLALVILPLFAVKASAVFDENLFGFIGISYITFKAVQVLIEVRDGLIKDMRLSDLLYFLLFFPSFTSGPITRSRDFIPQSRKAPARAEYAELLATGVLWMLKGAVYTFVLSGLFSWLMWFAPSAIGTADALHAMASELAYAFFYGLFLFFDFAGYSFMAMGAGSVLGIRVPTNFRAPFLSVDIKDFWNRWHITLSFWLRDYVFMRMMRGILKRKLFKSRTTVACLGFISEMLLMGAWHGFTASCIAYGLYHGCLLAACELFQKTKLYKAHGKKRWFKVASWSITMVAIFFGFSIFSGQIEGLITGVRYA